MKYSTGYEELNYGNVSWWPLKKTRRFALSVGYNAKTDTRYHSNF